MSDPNNVIEQLLEAIKQHPCVYDTKRLDFRDQQRKLNPWEEIRKSSGLATVEECHKLWKRLRDRFTREFKVIELATRSGSGYVPRQTWEFAAAMEFYKTCGRPRKTISNVGSGGLPGDEDSASTAEAIFNTMQGEMTTPPPARSNDITPEAPAETHWEAACQEDRTVGEPPSKRSKKSQSCDYIEQQLLSQLGKQITENEAFAQSVAMSLDRMPRAVASRCKARIMGLIAEFDEL
ncbi:transcription factor Adf-1-like [Dermacentor albipictus]|uniref:transcription factor Adf-1-like n=1 Tax=Dermacentor albipictus TaxID=60249 RepID=UPI0031FC1AA7